MQDLKNIKLNPGFKKGTIAVPSSKSISHRALICAALSKEQSNIYEINRSDDIDATIDALEVIKKRGDTINCKESGSTLRFLIPVAAALGLTATFTGEGSLFSRPISLYGDLFKDKGVDFKSNDGKLPVTVSGKLLPGKFYVPGNISSQFITGLMFALPLLNGDSEIIITSTLESALYIYITIDVLKSFGIKINKIANIFYIKGRQKYQSANYTVEGDFSQAAFFACAGAINGNITIKNLNPRSLQGDYKIIDILREFGVKIYFDGGDLRVKKCKNLNGIKIDASQIPDLVPVLSVVAAYAKGETVIYNAERLHLKESDRINATCEMLKSIGADVKATDDGMIINGTGGEKLRGGFVKSCNDHRIAMSAAVASIWTENGVTVDDMGCINKSYPMFLQDFEELDRKTQFKDKKVGINIVVMIFLLLMFIIGLIFAFSASANAKSLVLKAEPRIDFVGSRTAGLESLFYSYMFIYLIIGIVLSLISGIGLIFNGINLYKKIKKESKK